MAPGASAPTTWPPHPLQVDGWVRLAKAPTVDGPWTAEVRHALRVLDPLPVPPEPGSLHIGTMVDRALPEEGYRLRIRADGVAITAGTARGALQAAMTVHQLLPAESFAQAAARRDDWQLPLVCVSDAPALPHRGVMLDVSRHHLPVPDVLRWIELAALHRLNRLHLHLTDDQGWRLPSQAYPALVEVASWRTGTWIGHSSRTLAAGEPPDDGTPHGGHYTVADLRQITEHARRHGITVVPEVDLPGHASALLAAIPALAVPGCPPQQVATRWGLLGRTISPLPEAMGIVGTLLGEVSDMIDSPYLHIGGDEADLSMWRGSAEVRRFAEQHGGVDALRGVVNAQLAGMVTDLGRVPVAWDDAFVAGGLPTQTVVMAWRSVALGLAAAAAGHDVVMAPVMPTYFDYAEDAGPDEPLSIGAPLTLGDVASWIPPVAGEEAPGAVLGGQGQLWAEYMPDNATSEYRAFPRLSVLAANLWRGRPTDLAGQAPALAAQLDRLRARHVALRPATGPHPWQRAGHGARAPIGILPMAQVVDYLRRAAGSAEPPPA